LKILILKLLLLFILFFFLVSISMGSDKSIGEEDNALKDTTEALASANDLLGINNPKIKSPGNTMARLISSGDVEIPAIGQRFADDTVWQVIYKNITTKIGNGLAERDYTLYLNRSNGRLLGITSSSEKYGDPDILPAPPPEGTWRYIEGYGVHIRGLVDETPTIEFFDALEGCYCSPSKAKFIEAVCVDMTYTLFVKSPGVDLRAWIFIIKGSEELAVVGGARPDLVPKNERNSFLFVISAESGKRVFSTGAPRTIEQ